jgi:serine/threonine protein kinase
LENLHIKLIDYGQGISGTPPTTQELTGDTPAIPVNSPVDPDQNLQFHLVRAPEVILRSVWSPAMDIWSVGCLVHLLIWLHFPVLNTYSAFYVLNGCPHLHSKHPAIFTGSPPTKDGGSLRTVSAQPPRPLPSKRIFR